MSWRHQGIARSRSRRFAQSFAAAAAILGFLGWLALPLPVGLPNQEQIEVLGAGLEGIDDVHIRGLPHASCWVHIIGPSGMLLAKRAMSVKTCPGTWASFGEHSIPGEPNDACAARTMTEELNLRVEDLETFVPVAQESLSGWFYHYSGPDGNGVSRTDVQMVATYIIRLTTLEQESEFVSIAIPGEEEGDVLIWAGPEQLKGLDVCGDDFLLPYLQALSLP